MVQAPRPNAGRAGVLEDMENLSAKSSKHQDQLWIVFKTGFLVLLVVVAFKFLCDTSQLKAG